MKILSGKKNQLQNYMEKSVTSITPWADKVVPNKPDIRERMASRAQSAHVKDTNQNIQKSFVFKDFNEEKELKGILMENQLKQSKNFTNAYLNFKNIYGRHAIKKDVPEIEKVVKD